MSHKLEVGEWHSLASHYTLTTASYSLYCQQRCWQSTELSTCFTLQVCYRATLVDTFSRWPTDLLNALFTYACICVWLSTLCTRTAWLHSVCIVGMSSGYRPKMLGCGRHAVWEFVFTNRLYARRMNFTLSVAKFCIQKFFPSIRIPFWHLLQLTEPCVLCGYFLWIINMLHATPPLWLFSVVPSFGCWSQCSRLCGKARLRVTFKTLLICSFLLCYKH